MGGGHIKDRMLITTPEDVGNGNSTEKEIAKLKKKWPDIEITYHPVKSGDAPPDPSIFHDKTILVTLFTLPPSPDDCPNMQLVHVLSAGADRLINHPLYTDSDIILTTSSGVHGPQISEWVIMTALIQSHHYNTLYEQQKRHEWGGKGRRMMVNDMVGQKIGILGYGSIGRQGEPSAEP